MSLLNEQLIQRFKEVGEQIPTNNPLILARLYIPWNDWEWLVSEYYPKANAFYGYVIKDWIGKRNYFSIPEAEWLNEFQIQRDPEFTEVFFDTIDL